MNKHSSKILVGLVFILALSFAFYFALASLPAKAQTGTVIISNERASTITPTSATIRWTTNISASSYVQGTGCSDPVGGCNFTANNNTTEQVTAHVVSISGLRPGIRYTYWVSSKNNDSGFIAQGSNKTFTTSGGPTPEVGGCTEVNIGGGQTISTCHLECVNSTCTQVNNIGSNDPNKDGCTAVSAKCGPFASVTGGAGGGNDLPGIDLTIQDVFDIIYGFACWLWSVAMILLVIFIIISGIRFMYAGADPTKLTNAKQNFKYVIIGTIVVMGTFVIIATVAYNIGGNVSFIPFDCSGGSGNIEPEPSVTPTATPLSCTEYCQAAAEDVCSAAGGDYQQCYDEEYSICANQECVGVGVSPIPGVGYCGDGRCNANAGETASSCPSDCSAPPVSICSDPRALAAQYNEPYPARNSPELVQLRSCIESDPRLAGKSLGSIITSENPAPLGNDLCNYTRGDRVCGSCSFVANSCHYGGRTGSTGARAVNYGNEGIGLLIIQIARDCGAKSSSRCQTSQNQTVACPNNGLNSANVHVQINTATCDTN